MTRINFGIPPKCLSDRLLFAEHREIKRICAEYKRGTKPLEPGAKFRFGPGHVRFFVDKPGYTYARYQQIKAELIARNMAFTDFSDSWSVYEHIPAEPEVVATQQDRLLTASRLCFAIDRAKNDSTYYGKAFSKSAQKQALRDEVGELEAPVWQQCTLPDNLTKHWYHLHKEPWMHCTILSGYLVEFVWDVRIIVGQFPLTKHEIEELHKVPTAYDNHLAILAL